MANERKDDQEENDIERVDEKSSSLENRENNGPKTSVEPRSTPELIDDVCRNWHQQPVPQQHYKNAEEYAKAVRLWLHQCYYWQNVASSFPYFLLQQMIIQQQQQLSQSRQTAEQNRRENGGPATWNSPFSFIIQIIRSISVARRLGNIPRVHNPSMGRMAEIGGREFKIPRLWKRFTAEFVDFAILFLLKLFFTFIAMDFFDMIDLQKYNNQEDIQSNAIDYKFALQITSEIFILELIHRVVVCFFEALCLHQGTNGIGGATPGKSLLGLRVVSCESIQPIEGSRVLVWPAGDIGFGWALLRSVIKNFSMAFFIPACVTMFFFPFHRTVYDILCGCLVVEDIQAFPRQQ